MAVQTPKQKSRIKSQIECPTGVLSFQRMFPDELACIRYLEKIRWPNGFVCEKCSKASKPIRLKTRPRVLKCRICYYQSSATAGTVMHRSKTSIHAWFWAAYFVSTQTPGISALELQKKLEFSRYETAFQMLHKLRATMVRPDRDRIGSEWPLEFDIINIGGKSKSGIQGKTDQVPVMIAVEICRHDVRDAKTKKIKKRGLAGRLRLKHVSNKAASSVDLFAAECIEPGAVIISDDGSAFTNLKTKYKHRPVTMNGDREKMDAHLPMLSRVTANLKTWLDGTFHGVREKHLQTYLNEYMFRFNRRFYRATSFRTLLGLGTAQPGLTYRQVYAAETVGKKS
jgi:hypothetical protein